MAEFFKIDLSGEEFTATPYNTALFTFAGKTVLENGDAIDNSSRNHVYLMNEGRGTYIFGQVVNRLGARILREDFPATLNQRVIPEYDEDAYQLYLGNQTNEVEEFFPEDWS